MVMGISYRIRVTIAGACLAAAAQAQNSAPSSHLYFSTSGGSADILINEVRIPLKTMNTYYETLGWGGSASGYAGLQEHPSGRNFIFSIWDNASHRAPIKAVFTGHGTTTEKFGGEGTGLKSWTFKLPWEANSWYTLAARAWPVGQDTYCGMWVKDGATGKWRHLITMDVAAANAYFQGSLDAFIEDWSATGANRRETHIRKPWRRKTAGTWEGLTQAGYSVNKGDLGSGGRSYNFRQNWDGGKRNDATGDFFYMTSGGAETVPTTANPSNLSIARADAKPAYAAIALKNLTPRMLGTDRIEIAWERDSLSLPQFKYILETFSDPGFAGTPIAAVEKSLPDQGKDTVSLAGKGNGPFYGRLTLVDILDNRAQIPAFALVNGALALRSPALRSRPGSEGAIFSLTSASSLLSSRPGDWVRADGAASGRGYASGNPAGASGAVRASAAGAYFQAVRLPVGGTK
jgi:hypothetical protein